MYRKLRRSHPNQAIVQKSEDLAGGWAIYASARLTEVGMVKDIEDIGPKLRVESLCDGKLFAGFQKYLYQRVVAEAAKRAMRHG